MHNETFLEARVHREHAPRECRLFDEPKAAASQGSESEAPEMAKSAGEGKGPCPEQGPQDITGRTDGIATDEAARSAGELASPAETSDPAVRNPPATSHAHCEKPELFKTDSVCTNVKPKLVEASGARNESADWFVIPSDNDEDKCERRVANTPSDESGNH